MDRRTFLAATTACAATLALPLRVAARVPFDAGLAGKAGRMTGLSIVRQLAAHFGLTERTIYRDLVALGEAGVPIVGEAGVGYSLRRGYHLPPVMFSPAEALALATGGLFAERMTDASVGESIRLALGKVSAVLPPDLQDRVQRLR